MITADRRPDSLLPPSFHGATMLWWLWILPQTILVGFNLHNFFLVNGEMTLAQITLAGQLGAAGLGLLVFGCLILFALRLLQRPIPWSLCWPILAAHTAYLWWFTASLASLLPGSVTVWILPETRVLYQQFALIMPVLFYAMLRIACFPAPWSRSRDIALCVGVVAAGILTPLALTHFASHWRWSNNSGWAVMAVFVLLTAGILICILRLLVHLEVWLEERGRAGRLALAGLVGLAGPLGGLLLNRTIPFPADYQCVSIYVLAIVNGLLLVLPSARSPRFNLVVWCLQAALFPFTFYFFLVFLPFMPLSVLAILAVGTGFLVLVPMALFIIHGRRVLEGLRLAQATWGPLIAKLALVAALAVLPLFFAASALLDRAGLRQAIGYVFESGYEDSTFSGSLSLVRRTLGRMVEARDGRQLPFLSGCYNRIVFGGLVLPDDKLRKMQVVFFGGLLPRRTKDGVLDGMLGRSRRGVMQELGGEPDRLQPFSGTAAKLADVLQDSEVTAGSVRTLVTLKMTNEYASQSEFVARLALPDSVFVSGLWLHIGKTRVAGQLFEKKTALWVYRMITSERRDPALLVYTGPETAELRVFPFDPHQERVVEIELIHPPGRELGVRIGDCTVRLPALGSQQGITFAPGSGGTGTLLIPEKTLPTVTRKPYLHFILDQSSFATSEPLADRIKAAAARFPGITECIVTLANYEFAEPAGTPPRPLSEVVAILANPQTSSLPRRGGFCRDRAIQRALLQRARRLDDATTADVERLMAPVFVVLQTTNNPAAADNGSLAWFKDMTPDFSRFYVITGNETNLCPFGETSLPAAAISPVLESVTLLHCGKQFVAFAPSSELLHVDRLGEDTNSALRVYQPDAGRFVAWPAVATYPDGAYRNGLQVWSRFIRLQHDPGQSSWLWPEVVGASKDCGVMIPATAWIVVENSAQRKMLAMKEKQKLKNSESLDFQNVPEPGTVSLALLGALILGGAWLKKRRWSCG